MPSSFDRLEAPEGARLDSLPEETCACEFGALVKESKRSARNAINRPSLLEVISHSALNQSLLARLPSGIWPQREWLPAGGSGNLREALF